MRSFNKFLIPGAVVASLVLAACGGSSHSSSSPASSSAPASNQSAYSSTGTLKIGIAKGSMGTYLTGASGRALYIWVADGKGKSSCAGACAQTWPPLTTTAMPHVAGGVHAGDLTLISRSGGNKQVAYMGRPLYYYAGDPSAGSTNGNGSDQFGAKWWLISPSGGQLTGTAASASSAASSSSSGGSSTGSSGGGGWG